ncbi:MAG: hypothetical protein JNK76_22155 [Planctomycetales bacterium]|nr:hypothetical protein [Planctomycetales bacterium]
MLKLKTSRVQGASIKGTSFAALTTHKTQPGHDFVDVCIVVTLKSQNVPNNHFLVWPCRIGCTNAQVYCRANEGKLANQTTGKEIVTRSRIAEANTAHPKIEATFNSEDGQVTVEGNMSGIGSTQISQSEYEGLEYAVTALVMSSSLIQWEIRATRAPKLLTSFLVGTFEFAAKCHPSNIPSSVTCGIKVDDIRIFDDDGRQLSSIATLAVRLKSRTLGIKILDEAAADVEIRIE